jgi:hypothetical protein
MKNSGSKLILVMCGLALVAAVSAWWSRYAATHRAAEFWGPEAAALLRGPSQVELLELDGSVSLHGMRWDQATWQDVLPVIARHNITDAQGLSHLRSALVEDRNYDWDQSPAREADYSSDTSETNPRWIWALRLTTSGHAVTVLLTRDFSKLGKLQADGQAVTWVSCRPLMVPLVTYFKSLEAVWEGPGAKHDASASE